MEQAQEQDQQAQQEQPQQPPQPPQETTADEAYRTYEASRLKREATEGRCLLGFVVWTFVQQAMGRTT
jgi:hypothetical protein